MKYLYLFLAIFTICCAHIIRTKRWKLFIEIYEEPNEKVLLQSLSLGHFINFFVPFKLGDLVRALFASKYMKNGKTLSLTTVVLDRYLDIISVGIIFLLVYFINGDTLIRETIWFYIVLMMVLIIGTAIIFVGKSQIKKMLMFVSGIFNPNLELKILKLSWSLIINFKDIVLRISKIKLFITTIGMWAFYLCSYAFFANYLSQIGLLQKWIDIFVMFFSKNTLTIGTLGTVNTFTVGDLFKTDIIGMSLYLCMPIVLLFLYSFTKKNADTINQNSSTEQYLNLLPQLNDDEKRKFLEIYFSDENTELIKNYLKINQKISIIRDFSAGSNATTMLCMDEKQTFFRKYAFRSDGDKLYEQILWILKHKEKIPLPEIISYEKEENYCYYDMPYKSNSVGLFTYAHSMPIEQSWTIIKSALETLDINIYQKTAYPSDEETISVYVRDKVQKNINKICDGKYIKELLEYDEIIINGISYPNLKYYESILSKEHLIEVFKNDNYSDIHGDLTIENIICTRGNDGRDEFYIIDPNTGNIHNSPNLDYGKLLQSIHGGYEFLMATKSVEYRKNKIDFTFTKSHIYMQLHERLRNYMMEKFTTERVKSIYYHEIIHWLRLMPYKIERDGKRSLLFYAGLLMVLNDVVNMFDEVEYEE